MKAGNSAPKLASLIPPIKIAMKIKGAILIKEKFIFLSSLGICIFSTCFLIKINIGERINIRLIARVIGIIPFTPKKPTNNGPIAKPIVIAEL